MTIKNFIRKIQPLIRVTQNVFYALCIACFVTLASFPISAQAQGVGGFNECDFQAAASSSTNGTAKFQSCVRQVLTFIFVIGLFLIAFRIGLAAFNNLNPQTDSKAIQESITSIQDIFIGLFLIGAPGLILATLNPALLSLSFLDLGNIGNNSNRNTVAQQSVGSNPNSGNQNNNGTTSEVTANFAKQLEDLKKKCDAGDQNSCGELRTYSSQLASCVQGGLSSISSALGIGLSSGSNATCPTLTDATVSNLLKDYSTSSAVVEGSWLFKNNTDYEFNQATKIVSSALTAVGNNVFYARLGPERPTNASQNVTIRLAGAGCVTENAQLFNGTDIRKDNAVLPAGTTLKTSANCQISYVG